MSLRLEQQTIYFSEQVSVEEAETLLGWLLQNPALGVDLEQVQHLHTANLQVLMAARPQVLCWPQQSNLRAWLQAALMNEEEQ